MFSVRKCRHCFLPRWRQFCLPDAPGESGFHNDAAHLAGSKPPILKYSSGLRICTSHTFAQDSGGSRDKIFGFKEEPVNLAENATANKTLQRFTRNARGAAIAMQGQ